MKRSRGFTLVEILVAVVLAAIFLPAIGRILSLSTQSSSQGESFAKAYGLGQEGMEAIYNLKAKGDSSWNWSSTPTNTDATHYYQPTQSSGVWTLGSQTTSPTVTSAPFTLTVQINQVRRDASHNISANGADPVDFTTRKIIVKVTWHERGQTQSVLLTSYVAQH